MDLLTTGQAAEKLGISGRTLEAMRLTGRGPSYIKLGKLVRYSTDLLEQWLMSNRRISTSCTN